MLVCPGYSQDGSVGLVCGESSARRFTPAGFHFQFLDQSSAIMAAGVAVFILDANPLTSPRPVIIAVAVPKMFAAIPVAPIVIPIAVSATVVIPPMIPFAEAAITIAVPLSAFTARSLPLVSLGLLLRSRRGLPRALSEAGGHPAYENSRGHQ